jgi:predicted flap endonuclease-1-like 5' DNA nuclease
MSYLITQIFVALLVAGLLGLLLGWYLTRIGAASARSALLARLKNVEDDARALRGEVDVAVNARGGAEAEQQRLADELAALQAANKETAIDANELADLQARLKRADDDANSLRSELDAALQACGSAEAEQRRLADELAALQGLPDEQLADVAASEPTPRILAAVAQAAASFAQDTAEAEPDDLQQIKGIGPKIADQLNELGVLRLQQIAEWTPENVAWVNEHLKFKGRIEREEWIPQAQALIAAREIAE